jgi:NitT/TauT family transport system ATP-binding protein
MPNKPVLACEKISRSFDSGGARQRVLQDIDLQLDEGECLVLIGPSGCGKSTLLNIIAGFDRPSSGRVLLRGRPVEKPGPDKAMVFQDYTLLPWLNARENIEIGLRIQNVPALQRRATALQFLELVGLAAVAERPSYKLSGGMQQRVAIARALALRPSVLLMDEPFGALDAFQRAIMHREVVRIWHATKASTIFVTHSLEEAIVLGDRVISMAPGAIGLTGMLEINLPRPRNPLTDEFAALKRRLFGMLTAHQAYPADAYVE